MAAAAMSEPYAHGRLDVGDGHRIYWETCGDPTGPAAVVLHGGPGSGAGPSWRALLEGTGHRAVLFDQRGCGRSLPRGRLAANTTHHLIADIEALRGHLDIDRWLVLGGSWGSTLGLAYAEAHPDRVSRLVLFSVATSTRREVAWVTREMGRLLPAEWERFRAGVPETQRDGSLVDAYARLLDDTDPSVRQRAARNWCDWETAHMGVRDDRYDDPAFRLCFARLVTHYWRHGAWLEEGALLRDAGRLAGIPGVLIHGRRDLSSPLDVPWHLARAWPHAELVVIEDEGHLGGPAMTGAIRAALTRPA